MQSREMLIQFLVLGLVLFFVRPPLMSQSSSSSPPEVLTLDGALELASKNNRQEKNASLEVFKAGERSLAGRSLWFPTFDLRAQGLQQIKPIEFIFQQGIFGVNPSIGPIPATDTKIISPARPTGIINFRVSQPLSELYRISLQNGGLRLNREIASERLRAQQHEIVQKVKQVYWAIFQSESGLQSSNQSVKRYRELERETDEYLAHGEALKGDSLQVKLRLAQAEDEVISQTDQLAEQKQQLNQLMGRDLLVEFNVSPIQEEPADDASLAAGRAKALDRRPELREARLRVQEAVQDRRIKKSEYIPAARLTGQYLATENFNEIIPRNALAVGISVDWDVFDWGRKKHELKEKELSIEQLANNLHEIESSVLLEVDTKFRNLQRARQRLRIADLSRQLADEKVRVVSARYQVQASLLKDVLQEEAAFEEANHQYQVAMSTLWIAKTEFDNATGEDNK